MLIEIIDVGQETKTSSKGTAYSVLNVTFRNRTFKNKVESKNLFSFGVQQGAFDTLSQAQKGDLYEITLTKNDKGYNDWTSCVPSTGESASAPPASTGAAGGTSKAYSGGGRDFETKEERTNKQRYIVRQSSIDYAIKTLTPGAKGALDQDLILETAAKYEQWVFASPEDKVPSVIAGIGDDPSLADMEDDIPF
ncbi:hypothetical protein vBAfQDWS535_30 [Alcaligenes phage vB_Af_QDWS535]|nr:hypothetical protein vBAfQDWS535_30 [Alcaligenes phage vB_Af_QDWS535]